MNTGIFERTISLWTSTKRSAHNRSETTVGKFLAMGEQYRDAISQLRSIYNDATTFYHQDPDKSKQLFSEYKLQKQNLLPLASISGNFVEGGKLENLTEPTNLICIDIDQCKPHEAAEKRVRGEHIPNETVIDWESLKRVLSRIPYVAYCAISVSGHGVYLIIPIKSAGNHLQHWLALEYLFFKHYGLTIDVQTKDMSRARFVSYDPHPYINPNAKIFSAMLAEKEKEQGETTHDKPLETHQTTAMMTRIQKWTDFDKAEACVDEICRRGLIMSHEQGDWVHWGYALGELGEAGRPLFHRVSSLSSKYNRLENDKMYSYILRTRKGELGLSAFFDFCKEKGIMFADIMKEAPPMQILVTPPTDTQTAETINEATEDVEDERSIVSTLADNLPLARQMLRSSDTIERCKALIFLGTYTAAMKDVENWKY